MGSTIRRIGDFPLAEDGNDGEDDINEKRGHEDDERGLHDQVQHGGVFGMADAQKAAVGSAERQRDNAPGQAWRRHAVARLRDMALAGS